MNPTSYGQIGYQSNGLTPLGQSTGAITIRKFLLHETGTYGTQYRRPYDTSVNGDTIKNVLERLSGSNKYSPSLIGGLGNRFITPSASPEKAIEITNGWSERRLRFMMEVEYNYGIGGGMVEVVMGYSNYSGVSINGSIDYRMEFYVNSIMEVRNTISVGPTGNQMHTSIADSSHILVDNNWTGVYSPERNQNMRPTDVYTAMSRIQLRDIPHDQLTDVRNLSTNNAVKSRRSNSSATEYVSRIFNGYTQAVIQQPFAAGESDIITTARGLATENLASSDPFLSAIMNIRGDGFIGNTFTFGDLKRLDPNIENVTRAQLLSPTTNELIHHAGQTSEWHASDMYTQVATNLSQSVPAMLMDLAMTRVVFKSSNRDIGCVVRTVIMDAQGFANGDLTKPLQAFISRIESEILMDISFNNSIEFAIEMRVDLLGETWLSLSLDGKPFVDYVTPSFCDALLVPVVTNNNERVLNLASDFQVLSEALADNVDNSRHSFKAQGFNDFSVYKPGML